MSDFNEAVKTILRHEGHLEENDKDPGGATNYGISLRFLKALRLEAGHLPGHLDHPGELTVNDIEHLTVEEATALYKKQFWERYQYGAITDQKVATKVFDMAVNMGAGRAAILTQSCVKANFPCYIKVDGQLGPRSFEAINSCPADTLWADLMKTQGDFYTSLFYSNPDQYRPFVKGWMDRAYDRG